MLSKYLREQMYLSRKVLKKLEEQNFFGRVFRTKEVEGVYGYELTSLERYGLITCVAREVENVEIETGGKTYYAVNTRTGQRYQNLKQLQNYADYKLVQDCEKITVKSKYKVYKVNKTYDQFIADLKESLLIAFEQERQYVLNRRIY